MAKGKIQDRDKGYRSLIGDLKDLTTMEVKVGIQSGTKAADGMDLARLAAIHEFGGSWSVSRRITHFKKLNSKGTKFLRQGRFVKKKSANYSESFNTNYTLTIPSRPFMRRTVDEGKDEIGQFAQGVGRRVVIRKLTARQAMHLIGQKVEGMIKKKIVDGPWTPNKPSTIRQKRSSRPLIDTGRLRQSVRYVVKRRKGK